LDRITRFRGRIGLSPVSQIGVWVRDLNRTVEQCASLFGMGPFQVHDFEPDEHWYLETPSPLKMRLAKAPWGAVELELIQPLMWNCIHRDRLQSYGDGLGHLGFKVTDYEKTFESFLREGFVCLERAESFYPPYDGTVKAAYFDTRRIGGVVFQIMWRSWENK
jgi:methylmalonyl-CoA/ethylmalonyl-CoA epimerase